MMKKTKIANYLKTGILFVSVCLLLWNCEKNDILEEVNQLSVPSIEQSKNAFLTNKKLSKGTNSFLSKIVWDESSEILYKDDIKVLNSPLKINSNKIKSFVASVEKDGKIENKIITLVFDDDSNNNYFSGKLFIHNGDGSYDKGFKYEKGKRLGIYKINTTAYKNKGSCTAVTLTAGELIMLMEAGMLDGTETNIFGCEVEIESVGEGDTGGDDNDYWEWPDDNFGEDDDNKGGSGVNNWWTPFFQINDLALKPCMKTIVADIKTLTNDIKGIITKFSGNVAGYNWELKDGTTSGNATAQTSTAYDRNTGTVTTTFDTQKWNNASDLSWARTIMHESVHAYIKAFLGTDYLGAKSTFADYFKDYQDRKYPNDNDRQHAEFVRNYVNEIKLALKEYGTKKGYNLSDQFYSDMSWGGLTHWNKRDNNGIYILDSNGKKIPEETPWFKAAFPDDNNGNNDRGRVLDTQLIELTKKDSNGFSKTPKGNSAGC